jgi:uncharacterized protein YbbK (DUF523 family)
MTRMNDKPLVGISACLLGEMVRYDGGSKLDPSLRDALGAVFEFISVCPEVESGMGVPREKLRLIRVKGEIRMMTLETALDRSRQMQDWTLRKLTVFSRMPLCGYIFKARSPSCGVRDVPCHDLDGTETSLVSGLFARAFTDRYPTLPVADEEQLHDQQFRDGFIERVFNLHRDIMLPHP